MGRTLARSGAPIAAPTEAAWPSGEWWRRFRSPELDRIVETALAENQSLKKAMEALRDAEAFSQVARGAAVALPQRGYGHAPIAHPQSWRRRLL